MVEGKQEVVFGVWGAKSIEDLQAAAKYIREEGKKLPVMKVTQHDFAALMLAALPDEPPEEEDENRLKVVACLSSLFHRETAREYPMDRLITIGNDLPSPEEMYQQHVLDQLGETFEITRLIDPPGPMVPFTEIHVPDTTQAQEEEMREKSNDVSDT